MKNVPGKWTPPSRTMALAPVMMHVAPATIEPESHLTLPPTWRASCRRVKTMASIVVRISVRLHISSGSGGLKNTRITEGTQQFILVQAD
jgi:hypothetical protein